MNDNFRRDDSYVFGDAFSHVHSTAEENTQKTSNEVSEIEQAW
jgi:hypothetical protein